MENIRDRDLVFLSKRKGLNVADLAPEERSMQQGRNKIQILI
ncbi:hypothetical protein [Peribacillus simplex]